MGPHQNKNLFMADENSIKIKREPTVWENMFANDNLRQGPDLQNI